MASGGGENQDGNRDKECQGQDISTRPWHQSIQRHYKFLLEERIEPSDILPHLYSQFVITFEDKEYVEKGGDDKTMRARLDRLLEILFKKGGNVWEVFRSALLKEGYEHVVVELDNALKLAESDNTEAVEDNLKVKGNPPIVEEQTDGTRQRTRETQLVTACLRGILIRVKALVDKGQASLECCVDMPVGDQHYEDMTPLWAASKSGKVDIVKYLVGKGASVGGQPLLEACHHGYLEIVQLLLGSCDDVKVNYADPATGFTSLMYACQEGHLDIANALLNNGANVDTTDNNGATALIHACNKGHVDIVKALLTNDADVNIDFPDEGWQK